VSPVDLLVHVHEAAPLLFRAETHEVGVVRHRVIHHPFLQQVRNLGVGLVRGDA
jgi:hypothetical protein